MARKMTADESDPRDPAPPKAPAGGRLATQSAHVVASKAAAAERLAAALRANLQRRKAQARGRATASPGTLDGKE
ncbi:MAG: hypothetical protein JWL62_2256 [Hyphomicrobiales bacterium]|nr:hypothetical protein [Hyphomicrobiales bacterium]